MTDRTTGLEQGNRDVAFKLEEEMQARIDRAYDEMGPTPEQEQRMLEELLRAQKAKEGQTGQDGSEQGLAANRKKRFRVWQLAVPLAACLVAGAVVIGIGSSPQQAGQAPDANTVKSSSSEQKLYNVAEPQATANSNARQAADGEGYMPMASEVDAMVIEEPLEVEFNTEEYNYVDEHGFVSTKANPLSTVSADVDTASYCNVRRMLTQGTPLSKVPSGAVRIEEMLNYFTYDYEAPKGSDLFSMQAQSAPCPWNKDTQLLVMGFATAEESKAASNGSNLVFLIDVSGSMRSSDKLELLQDSFAKLVESLGPNDKVSIVTYASGEEIVLEGAAGDDDQAILKAIYKLQAHGSTNGQAGLEQAYQVAERNFIQGGVNRIIMASDGDLNVGITSTSDLHDYVDSKRESGVYLSVLGFGSGNYKDTKMEVLADHGNGSYHYIDCIEEAQRVFKERLTANLVPFADNVKVQVEFNPAQVKAYRLIGYENRQLAAEDFRNDAVDAGDVGPSSQFTVAYEVVLADSAYKVDEPELRYSESATYDHASSDWLTCALRYHAFDGDEMREQELAVSADTVGKATKDWTFAAAVIEFGMLAQNSQYHGTATIQSVMELLNSIDLNEQQNGFKQLVEHAQ